MEMKICTKCGVEKEISNFRIEKRTKIGLQSQCKQCEKEYRLKNREKQIDYMKKYYQKNKESLLQKNKIYRENHKEEKKIIDKIYRENHKKERNIKDLKRKEEDPIYKLKCNLRGMIKNSFRRRGLKKKQKAEQIYGCTVNELIEHLIKTYENNYNEKWDWKYLKDVHIDHIIPLANANTENEVKKLCHYTNLQLLKVKDNLNKKDSLEWELNNDITN